MLRDNAFSSVQLATDLLTGNVEYINIHPTHYSGTKVMIAKGKEIYFAEYKNLLTSRWGQIKKYEHEWYSCKINNVSIIQFYDKKNITLISTYNHGSELDEAPRTRKGRKQIVQLPLMVKDYSNGKVGVDVGDQKLRDKRNFADKIRSYGWN